MDAMPPVATAGPQAHGRVVYEPKYTIWPPLRPFYGYEQRLPEVLTDLPNMPACCENHYPS